MTRKIIDTIVGTIMIAVSTFIAVAFNWMIFGTLKGEGNYFTWINDLIFEWFYTGGPVTDEFMGIIHTANYTAAYILIAILAASFTYGIMTVILGVMDIIKLKKEDRA